jgi:undecaprenyl phosphate-alpha-L-ara4N flippase subunit ArnE
MTHLYTLFLVLVSAGFTVAANLTLKVATQSRGIGTFWPLNIVNGRMFAAAGCFGMAFLFYAMILKRMPLSLAQAILSMQYVLVILAANVLLGEPIGTVRWAGIAIVAIGLIVIGASPDLEKLGTN